MRQAVARRFGVGGGANQRDDLIEVLQRHPQAFQDVRPLPGPRQVVLGPAADDLFTEVQEPAQRGAEGQHARLAVHERDHVDVERVLHGRVLVEVVQHDAGGSVALQLDHHAHPFAVGLVPHFGDAFDLLLLGERGDLLDERCLVHLVGEFRDDDALTRAPVCVLHCRLRAHHDAPVPGLVGILDALPPHDRRGGGEVRPLHEVHQFFGRCLGVVHEEVERVADLAQVMWGDVRRHADRDAGRAVDQQVRKPCGEDGRLTLGAVVVVHEVDGVPVDVLQQLLGDGGEPRLRVAHRCGGVVVDGAEVALAVHQRMAHGEALRHTDESVVHRGVAVGVVLAKHLADDGGALLVGGAGAQPHALHRVEDAPVHRFQPVAHVRQGTGDDDAHGVVQVRAAHLLFYAYGPDVAGVPRYHAAPFTLCGEWPPATTRCGGGGLPLPNICQNSGGIITACARFPNTL